MATPITIKIHKFLVNYTGIYSDQFFRPYATALNDSYILSDIERCIHGNNGGHNSGLISGMMLGASAAAFCAPQANPGSAIVIPNGWSAPRLTFMLEVEVIYGSGGIGTGSFTELIQGYSNYNDPSHTGKIDPACEFYINSVTKLREIRATTPYGMETRKNVASSAHLVVNHNWSESGILGNYQQNQPTPTNMRPQDVYSSLSLPSDLRSNGDFLDARNIRSSMPTFSSRSNSLPTDYVGKIMQGFQGAGTLPQGMNDNVYTAALSQTQEDLPSRDHFIKALDALSGRNQSSFFSFQELMRFDPTLEVSDRMVITIGGDVDYRNNSQHMGGGDLATQSVALLFNGIPAMMAAFGVALLAFRATNKEFINGVLTPIIQFDDLRGFSGEPMPHVVNGLQARLQFELLDFISQRNAIDYHIEVRSIFTQDTHIGISLNGSPMIPYVNPTFADAMMAPVLANDYGRLAEVASDFDVLINHVLPHSPSLESFEYNDADSSGQFLI